MTNVLYWIWLQQRLGYASHYANDAIRHTGGARFFYESSEQELINMKIWPERTIARLRDHSLEDAELIYMKCLALGYKIITPDTDCYPMRLRSIADPPLVLYLCGDVSVINDKVMIAVVGTRKASDRCFMTARELGYRLSRAGATVVSGCAIGIDTAAHTGSVEAGGRTVGVLGCGLDYRYNVRGEKLRKAITTCGAIVSEYAPGTPARPENFPKRNRIISGLSLGVTVVQAREKSGSLITARLALEQGRDLFAYYSGDTIEMLAGIHSLGEHNVTLFNSPAGILRFYEGRFGSFINYDGTDQYLMSGEYISPDSNQNIVSDLSRQVDEKRRREAIRPTEFQTEPEPVAEISLEEERRRKKSFIFADNTTDQAYKMAFPEHDSELTDYTHKDSEPYYGEDSAIITNGNNTKKIDGEYIEKTDKNTEKGKTEAFLQDGNTKRKTKKAKVTEEQIYSIFEGLEESKPEGTEVPIIEKSGEAVENVLPPDISDEARKLYKLLSEHSDTIDNLAVLTGMTISMAAEFMLELELYGLVYSLPGGIYKVSNYYYQ